MSSIGIAIAGGLCGMLGWGGADFFAKKIVDQMGSLKSLVWAHLFGTLFFVLAALVQKLLLGHRLPLPTGISAWAGLAFFGILQMFVYWLLYEGFSKGQLAVLNPVFASYTSFVALASVLFFGEMLGAGLGYGLVLLAVGLLLINTDIAGLKSKKLAIRPGFKEVALATLLAAIWTISWDRFVNGHDALVYALGMYAFMTLAAYVFARITREKIAGLPAGALPYVVGIGLGEMIAYLGISWAYGASSHTSIIALVGGTFSLPTLVLAHFFLKEKVTRLQTLAALIIVASIAVIALA